MCCETSVYFRLFCLQELGLVLSEEDRKAINLNTTYLKFDNHEWGMCGFVDLTDDRVRLCY